MISAPHPMAASAAATAAYAVFYTILGWVSPFVTPQDAQIAKETGLAGTTQTVLRQLLRAVLIYGVLGWIATLASSARAITQGHSVIFTVLIHLVFFFGACVFSLCIVYVAFKARSECKAVVPEYIVALVMIGYVVFTIAPRTTWLWSWIQL